MKGSGAGEGKTENCLHRENGYIENKGMYSNLTGDGQRNGKIDQYLLRHKNES